MLDTVFRGLFDSDITAVISVTDFMLCLGFSLILGLVMAFAYMYRTRYTKSFVVTLALLPAVVCVVIMLVRQCGDRRCGRRCVQPGAISLCPRHSKGNLCSFSGNGNWPDCRNGLSGLFGAFYCGYVHSIFDLQPFRFWCQKESSSL